MSGLADIPGSVARERRVSVKEITLRYGINPQQAPARVYAGAGELPFEVLNGSPGFINLLDALNAWQLVRETRKALGLPAATSFKHVSPAGVGLGLGLDEALRKALMVEIPDLSPLACAYARARGADRLSSFGDFAALSDPCDLATARVLEKEVSDGIIAPGYEPAALEILKKKKAGKYCVLQIDPSYEPPAIERRELFGVVMEQKRNELVPDASLFTRIVTQKTSLSDEAKRDLVLANITLKYTQSNSVDLAVRGQMIGIGAGQQSRVHCTRLACAKAERWHLRQHPRLLEARFKSEVRRPERTNAMETLIEEDVTPAELGRVSQLFEGSVPPLSPSEKDSWLASLKGVCLASDAFFPFRDSIDRAKRAGVQYVVEPGGSARDEDVIKACDEFGMVLIFTKTRLFHH